MPRLPKPGKAIEYIAYPGCGHDETQRHLFDRHHCSAESKPAWRERAFLPCRGAKFSADCTCYLRGAPIKLRSAQATGLWPMASPMRIARVAVHSGLNSSTPRGNSITTVEPSRKRPISSPFFSTIS
jgi:hypothetical protein